MEEGCGTKQLQVTGGLTEGKRARQGLRGARLTSGFLGQVVGERMVPFGGRKRGQGGRAG